MTSAEESNWSWYNPISVASWAVSGLWRSTAKPLSASLPPVTAPVYLLIGAPECGKRELCRKLAERHGARCVDSFEATAADPGAATQGASPKFVAEVLRRAVAAQEGTKPVFVTGFPLTPEQVELFEVIVAPIAAAIYLHVPSQQSSVHIPAPVRNGVEVPQPAVVPGDALAVPQAPSPFAKSLHTPFPEPSVTEAQERFQHEIQPLLDQLELRQKLVRISAPRNSTGAGGSALRAVQLYLCRQGHHVVQPEVEDQIKSGAVPGETLELLQVIAKNLIGGQDRHRQLNTSTPRFQSVFGSFPAAMDLLQRLGFKLDVPEPGMASARRDDVDEPLCYLLDHLIERKKQRRRSSVPAPEGNPGLTPNPFGSVASLHAAPAGQPESRERDEEGFSIV
eukprot:TRINITY_DN69805_c0_g1_i1.p1 TRINITY_DN69805_c0_g1~~TRINITY_DN69805_c0_g1_i1.p1  ORF type:complete len:394 (+),score=55.56 TRINITY_DN69805_c0_g1_i1:71-1252(+)